MILLSTDDLPLLIEVANQEGLIPRISDAEDFARAHRILLLQHQESGINVDISLGILLFEMEAVERSITRQLGSVTLRLPSPEDLIILKAVAHRPKDLEDIQAIIHSHSKLDRARIKYWVNEFAQILEAPELWNDIAGWL